MAQLEGLCSILTGGSIGDITEEVSLQVRRNGTWVEFEDASSTLSISKVSNQAAILFNRTSGFFEYENTTGGTVSVDGFRIVSDSAGVPAYSGLLYPVVTFSSISLNNGEKIRFTQIKLTLS